MLELPDFDTAYARTFFPALGAGWALFENAGGTLVPTTVLDRLNAYMRESQVQPGAGYAASELAAQRMAHGHRMMAELLNAAPEEVMVGPSTTMNVYLLAQALRPGFRDGDEIIVTDLDHEANNGAWRRLAETGLRMVEWKVDPQTAELRPDDLAALLTDRTRLICFSQCSNITGGFNDVPAIARMAHEAGALVCVDGVAFAPHRQVDVRAWDVDFYLCSTYKIYGPHLGLLYGKRDHLLNARGQNHYFIAESDIPLKLNPGGP
ncbi:MAG TPA: aminotransferase class V-fold PLP-dependent enzyme, partial [Chromatiales bacterium]|nr:aminotransferase class V-fold PLP-dependent enzyme [Chromatiales bacterium]